MSPGGAGPLSSFSGLALASAATTGHTGVTTFLSGTPEGGHMERQQSTQASLFAAARLGRGLQRPAGLHDRWDHLSAARLLGPHRPIATLYK